MKRSEDLAPGPEVLWDRAWQRYQEGRLQEAQQACRQLLGMVPNHVQAWFYSGMIAYRLNRFPQAAQALARAAQLKPDYAEAHNNLGNALAQQGKFEDAERSFREALRLASDYPEALNNLGNVLRDSGRLPEAIEAYRSALALRSDYADAHNNLGIAHSRSGRLDLAIASYEEALRLRSDFAHALNNLGTARARDGQLEDAVELFERALRSKADYVDAHANLGTALAELGRHEEAIAALRQALQLQPRLPRARNNLGNVLASLGRTAEAIREYQQAIEQAPHYGEAYNNLGNALRERGDLAGAAQALRKALELAPRYPEAHSNLGIVLSKQRKFAEALFHYDQALALRPDFADAYLNRALTHLLVGEFEKGWSDYEWRWKTPSFTARDIPGPRWSGDPLTGRRILLHTEQGLGDTFQFVRYAELVKERGGHVILRCPRTLLSVLRGARGVDEFCAEDEELPPFDVHRELLSLPHVLGTSLSSIPSNIPYLAADELLIQRWREELAYIHAFKVGIAWQGNPGYGGDKHRSIPLAHFAVLAAVPNVRLFSLQRGPGTEQLGEARFSVHQFDDRFDHVTGSFCDTAAVMQNLDLVITTDSAVAHLAGALGVPAWVAIPYASDWRWLLARDDSPWYPTLRLFRQQTPGNWEQVFRELASALALRTRTTDSPAPLAAPPPTASELNAKGVALVREGHLDEALVCFRQAVAVDPGSPEAHNNLGNAQRTLGRLDEAMRHLDQALDLREEYAEAHNNRGIALTNLGRLEEAIAAFRRALELAPGYAHAHNSLGLALLKHGRRDDAIVSLRQAIRLAPDLAAAHNHLGLVLAETQQHEEAVQSFREALRLAPDYAEAHNNLGNVLREQSRLEESVACFEQALRLRPSFAEAFNNLGIALSRMERFDEAIKNYRQAIALAPGYAAAHNNLGIALANKHEYDQAENSYRQAIQLHPNYAEAHNNLAIVLTQCGRFDEAYQLYAKALELKPDYPEAHSNLGIALTEGRRLECAITAYNQALTLRPDYADAQMNRALTYLLTGDFDRGWVDYEARWHCREFQPRRFPRPRWHGEPLDGRRIMLHTEQGFGDTFQFVRYAKLVKERGGVVILRCPRPLVAILRTCPFLDEINIEGEALPDFDVHIELLSLPRLFGTRVETIPNALPYIFARADLVQYWRQELSYIRAFKIGINWQGNPRYRGDRYRSIPLAHFAPLAAVPQVRLINLQKGFGTEQLKDVRFSVISLGTRVDDAAGSFMDTAAAMTNLDLVVTSDTATVHLAGALGVPVWMALPWSADWRWMLNRQDCPWYPSMRIFRQQRMGQWEPVFAQMATALVDAVGRDPRFGRMACTDAGQATPAAGTIGELQLISAELTTLEDEIRSRAANGDFGPNYLELVQAAREKNEQRAKLFADALSAGDSKRQPLDGV